MRIPGEIRMALSAGFGQGPGTTRELALRTGVGMTAAMVTLNNMRRDGVVQVVDSVRLPHCKRPVPIYDRVADPGAAPASGADWSLVTCWMNWPRTA